MSSGMKYGVLLAPLLACLVACGGGDDTTKSDGAGMGKEPTTITNRIDVPSSVRSNLGITFAKVEMRRVASTTRVPGHFELEPEAHRAYHTTLSGQVELLVRQYQTVKEKDVLFRVNSAEWRGMQEKLTETMITIRRDHAQEAVLKNRMKAVLGHGEKLREQRKVWEDRLQHLQNLGAKGGGVATQQTEARASLAAVDTALAEVHEEEAEVEGMQAELREKLKGHRTATPLLYADALGLRLSPAGTPLTRDLALAKAAALLGSTVEHLREEVRSGDHSARRWQMIEHIEVVARHAGVVEELAVTNGAWIDAGQKVLDTVNPTRVRFRGAGLQADLGRMHAGMTATVLAPTSNGGGAKSTMPGTLTIGLEADALSRKIDLILTPTGDTRPHWARAGVSTEMEVVLQGTDEPELAIPLRSVIQDGLQRVIFRRNPKDKDQVIRLEADLGLTDGRWIVIESGVMEGDQIVLDGVYELMLASGSGDKAKGGHFHADGTFHEGDDN